MKRRYAGRARYPSNPVLRLITPQETCRKLDVYPVKLTQDAICVNVTQAASTRFQARSPAGSLHGTACASRQG